MEGENLLEATIRIVRDFGPRDLAASFFMSYDTQMYDYIAVLAPSLEDGRIKLGLGSGTLVEFLAHPFPANLTPFVERSSELKVHVFNYVCNGCYNPVISVAGTLFFDWWYPGVLFGGIVAGLALRTLSYRWSRAAIMSPSQNLVTAVISSYAMIAARTDTVYAIWWCIYSLIIAIAVLGALGGGEVLLRSRSRTEGNVGSQRRNGAERKNPIREHQPNDKNNLGGGPRQRRPQRARASKNTAPQR
ncbi:MAG: hypothetical protein K0U84_24510, partial [Actinomycetia bacterium]|nr:hypothetical protein [Actinomycetes bacterium]